jgi:beta-N-acetylhexosaminidase
VLALVPTGGHADDPRPVAETVEALARAMSPGDRVGQLFIVPFDGAGTADDSAIAHLIDGSHVGGVLLDPALGSFADAPDAPAQVARLVNALQARRTSGAAGVPLFIAVAENAEGSVGTALTGGMTPLPSAMALAATWDPDHAARIGEVVGAELRACGVNLFLGPALDVVAVVRPGTSGDLGVRAFGGSPPWVRRFGQRFIEGVHRGGGGQVAVVPHAFPGVGGADRNPDVEVAVVENPLEVLTGLDLVPFLGVVGPSPGTQATADALMTSHVRFRAIQQETERPFALDGGGLRYLAAQLPALAAWSDAGGVVLSPGLGLPAVRRYIDPDLTTFNERRVIGEALSAGNDLLLLTQFGPPADPVSGAANIEAGIAWLVERYERDEAVREAVDRALRRVLELKLRLYGGEFPSAVAVDAEAAVATVGLGREAVATVAREALTLLNPGAGAAGTVGRTSPSTGERILLAVDTRDTRACPECAPTAEPDPAGLVASVLRDYGPEGTGRVRSASDIAAVTFAELKAWLQWRGLVAGEDTPVLVDALPDARRAEVDRWLRDADWIVFAMRDLRAPEAPGSDALKLFLGASPPEVTDSRLVAVALGAPYYLDTTEIAKLSAYYAVYSHSEPFLDVAIRGLFGDAPATGASPVSVPGAGYDLARRLAPDPAQEVSLAVVGRGEDGSIVEGDNLSVRTSVVRDVNGRAAPDGTHVTFQRYDRAEDVFLSNATAETIDGQATAIIRADRDGEIVITAVFENGLRSTPLPVVIRPRGLAARDVLGLPEALLPDALTRARVPVDWGIFMLSLTLILLVGVLCYSLESDGLRSGDHVRMFLNILAWGLSGYLLVAAGGVRLGALPGGVPLWPRSWNPSYQAAVLSLMLALVPAAPNLLRVLKGRRGPRS